MLSAFLHARPAAMRPDCMEAGLPADKIEELIKFNGSVFILIDIVDHLHDILLRSLVTELLHDGSQFLNGKDSTLGEI